LFDHHAFGALIRQKRGEKGWTQPELAEKVFGHVSRKSDISRFERGQKVPQEDTVQKLMFHLDITEAEMTPIRQSNLKASALDNIPALSRQDLENLSARFNIDDPYGQSDAALRNELTKRAEDYRALRKEVNDLKTASPRFANQHAAAMHALDNFRIEEAEEILANAREVITEQLREPLEINAQLMEAQATAALLRGDPEQAYALLCAAADSFGVIDPMEPTRKRIYTYFSLLRDHGLRYGGTGLGLVIDLLNPVITETLKSQNDKLWTDGQNNLGIALLNQGTRTQGAKGTALLARAVTAYEAALTVCAETDHPVQWAMTQNNLGNALTHQGIRTQGAKGTALLARAVTALEAALTVYTETDHPVDWAMTQYNLAFSEEAIAVHPATTKRRAHLEAAIAHVDAALTIYDPEHMSYNYLNATRLRARLQDRLSKL